MAQLTVRDHMRFRSRSRPGSTSGRGTPRLSSFFDELPTTYYARLNALLDHPEPLAAYPMTVRRLLRLRDARRQLRSA